MEYDKELNEESKLFIEDLFQFLEIPSVTRDSVAVNKAANWLYERLKKTATKVEKIKTSNNPIIIAEWIPDKNKTTNDSTVILFYGHYDVQPPEPLDKWISEPFKPVIRDGRIYARGAGDNKGQLFAHLCAIEYLHNRNELDTKVKFIFDGDEELGSPTIEEAVTKKTEFFNDVDLIVVSDGPAEPNWKPTLEFGARGIQTFRMTLNTADNDVHSGNFGGIQPNPVWDLISILKTMMDDSGKCLIDGFYDDVFTPSEAAFKVAAELNRPPEVYKEQLGISYFGGEQDQELIHRVMFRPTFNIRGIKSGEVLENAKTIIPKDVIVEFDVRLVPYQKPDRIVKLFENHLTKLSKKSDRLKSIIQRCEIEATGSFYPMYTPIDLPWVEVLEEAIEEGFKDKPVKIPLAGGSLPLYSLYKATKKPIYIIPYAQPDENNHAPNENLMIEWFLNGIKTTVALLNKLSKGE